MFKKISCKAIFTTLNLIHVNHLNVGCTCCLHIHFCDTNNKSSKKGNVFVCCIDKAIGSNSTSRKEEYEQKQSICNCNHDIRASLAGISGFIDMSRAHASSESELENNLNDMESCTNDLLAILNSVLDQSKIEEGKKQLEEEEFDMEELLEHLVNIYNPKAAMKNVDVLLDPCDGPITRFSRVKGDRKEIRSILTNLLDNAVKFTSEGHISLRVWARKAGSDQSYNLALNTKSSIGWLSCFLLQNDVADSAELQGLNKVLQDPNCVEFVFEVDDAGKGIPKEKQKSVFENYVQVNETDGQTGTGLGLGIIQSLMSIGIKKAPKWWEKGLQPNMKEVTGAQDFVDSLLSTGDKLVVVDFFSPGCGGCKALHPKLAETNPDVQLLHVNYEELKSTCYSLNVHVLPFFRFYRGAEGRLCSFSCTNATIKKFKDALTKYGADCCSLGPVTGLEEKELLALAANKELYFAYTPKTEEPVQEDMVMKTSSTSSSHPNTHPPLPLPLGSTSHKAKNNSMSEVC